MASTTFELSVDRVMTLDEQEHLHKVLELIASAHGLDLGIKVVEPKLTYKIEQDQDPENPRKEWDNVGVMFCKHGRYALGDEGADDPYVTLGFYDLGGYKLYCRGHSCSGTDDPPENVVMYDSVFCMLQNIAEDIVDDVDYGSDEDGTLMTPDDVEETVAWLESLEFQTERVLRDDIAICLPLYLYDHSGITISHGAFSCKWDSGQVGWHYIAKAKLEDEFDGDEAKAMKRLECEIKTYDDYLQGNVWGYVIENEEGDDVDSCWGFYGDELEETGMLGDVAAEHVEGLKEAWERRFG